MSALTSDGCVECVGRVGVGIVGRGGAGRLGGGGAMMNKWLDVGLRCEARGARGCEKTSG